MAFTIEKYIPDGELKDELRERAKYHDLDKALLYTQIRKSDASAYHKEHADHHMENDLPKTKIDLTEAIMDYECAALTKPDKPLNAYDTVMKYDKGHKDELLGILHEMDMDHSYQVKPDADWAKELSRHTPVTEDAILKEIYTYCLEKPQEAKQVLRDMSM